MTIKPTPLTPLTQLNLLDQQTQSAVNKLNINMVICDPNLPVEYRPTYAYSTDGGLDLRACFLEESIEIPPYAQWTIDTGVAIQPSSPNDLYVAYLFPRSSLGRKGLRLVNTVGIIDSGYQNTIKAIVTNDSDTTITIQPYDRIVQLVLQPLYQANITVVESFDTVTDRGLGGFGSSGR